MKENNPASVLAALVAVAAAAAAFAGLSQAKIPTTLDGPFEPRTAPFHAGLRGHAVDLPADDPRLRRRVSGFLPEQIAVSLSVDYDSVWISWVTGSCFLPLINLFFLLFF